MNRLLLSATVATAVLLGAYHASAQTVLYTLPGAPAESGKPLGGFIAERIEDRDASEFKQWISQSEIAYKLDVAKGYTAFVVLDNAFDSGHPAHPVEHYIVNERLGLRTMQGNQDYITTINGDELSISRTGNSYYVDDMRVNGFEKNPEGVIYYIGGNHSAQNL
jgi:hypothetical protein